MLGFAISAVPGAVFFETIRRTLSKQYSVMPFQLGNFSGISTIILVALFGVATILSNSTSANVFYGLSGGLLLYLGIRSILTKQPQAHIITKKTGFKSTYSSFLTGYILAVANPLSIIFWISLIGKFHLQSNTFIAMLVNIISTLIGALMLFVLLIILVSYMRNNIKELYLIWMARIFGLILVAYGILTLSKLFQ
jgi:threonine/homoserine/homoserine lactone efflux protein